MSLATGVHYLAIPGPSVMPEAVLRAMHRPAPNIYTGELLDLHQSLLPDLRAVAGTSHDVAMYICNGHGAWEAAIANTLGRGDRVLALATGFFCNGWADMAECMGIIAERIDFGSRDTIDLARVEAALRADTGHGIKAVMCVQVDTSSSVRNDIPALRALLDRLGHPALLMVDCIACLACDRFEMDAWGVDVMVAASQKGLMTPPGLGFVYFGPKADAARDNLDLVSSYWDWRPRTKATVFYNYFCGTAPTHHLYGLRAALDMIMAEGQEAVLARHATLSRAIWAACEAWGEGGSMQLNIADPAHRSHAVTTLRLPTPDARRLREWVSANAGVTLGIGVGMSTSDDPEANGIFRIGHMGYVNAQMVMGALGSIEIALNALGIPHGKGALDAASDVMARA